MLEKVKEIIEKCEEVEVKIEKYTRFRRDLIAPGIEWWWQERLAVAAKEDGVLFEFDLSEESDYIWELTLPDRVAKYDERKKEDWTRLERDVLSLVGKGGLQVKQEYIPKAIRHFEKKAKKNLKMIEQCTEELRKTFFHPEDEVEDWDDSRKRTMIKYDKERGEVKELLRKIKKEMQEMEIAIEKADVWHRIEAWEK